MRASLGASRVVLVLLLLLHQLDWSGVGYVQRRPSLD